MGEIVPGLRQQETFPSAGQYDRLSTVCMSRSSKLQLRPFDGLPILALRPIGPYKLRERRIRTMGRCCTETQRAHFEAAQSCHGARSRARVDFDSQLHTDSDRRPQAPPSAPTRVAGVVALLCA